MQPQKNITTTIKNIKSSRVTFGSYSYISLRKVKSLNASIMVDMKDCSTEAKTSCLLPYMMCWHMVHASNTNPKVNKKVARKSKIRLISERFRFSEGKILADMKIDRNKIKVKKIVIKSYMLSSMVVHSRSLLIISLWGCSCLQQLSGLMISSKDLSPS